MKNKMPLDGLGLGHDSGSVHCDMLKMLCFRTAWGGGIWLFFIFKEVIIHSLTACTTNRKSNVISVFWCKVMSV